MKRRTLLKSVLGLASIVPLKFAAAQNLQGKNRMSDITPNVVVSMPSQLFTLARSFKAAANGKIYISKIDTPPGEMTDPDNYVQVYLENEDGGYVPVSQPLIINAGGFPVYNGQISKFVTVEGHSMAVYDAYGSQQFYFPNVLKYNPDQLRQILEGSTGINIIGGAPVYTYIPNGIDDNAGISAADDAAKLKNAYLFINGIAKITDGQVIESTILDGDKQIFTADSNVFLAQGWARPEWFGDVVGAVDHAINSMPIGKGGTIKLKNKRYKHNNYKLGFANNDDGRFMGVDNISLIGESFASPSYNRDRFENGAVIEGCFLVYANNFYAKNVAFDNGKYFIDRDFSGLVPNGQGDGLYISYPNATLRDANSLRQNITLDNVAGMCYSPTTQYHAILTSEGISAVNATTLHAVMGVHGVIVKGKNVNIDNAISECNGWNGVIVRGDAQTNMQPENVNIGNIKTFAHGMPGSSPHTANSLGWYGVMLNPSLGPITNVHIGNIVSVGHQQPLGTVGDYALLNTKIGNIVGDGFGATSTSYGWNVSGSGANGFFQIDIGTFSAINVTKAIYGLACKLSCHINDLRCQNITGVLIDVDNGNNITVENVVHYGQSSYLWAVRDFSFLKIGTVKNLGTTTVPEFSPDGYSFPLLNSWVSQEGFTVRLRNKKLCLYGLIKSGTDPVFMVIPSDFRPKETMRLPTVTYQAGASGTGVISCANDGYLRINEFSTVSGLDWASAALEVEY